MTEPSPMHDGARFIWRGKDCTTYGALGSALCQLQSEQDAAEFWEAYLEFLKRPTARLGEKTPEEVAGSNIGYLMGYYGPEERRRVYALFPQASHPIFGHGFGRGASDPTPEQAFEAGKRLALRSTRGPIQYSPRGGTAYVTCPDHPEPCSHPKGECPADVQAKETGGASFKRIK